MALSWAGGGRGRRETEYTHADAAAGPRSHRRDRPNEDNAAVDELAYLRRARFATGGEAAPAAASTAKTHICTVVEVLNMMTSSGERRFRTCPKLEPAIAMLSQKDVGAANGMTQMMSFSRARALTLSQCGAQRRIFRGRRTSSVYDKYAGAALTSMREDRRACSGCQTFS
mgnify:CR=1 FL=1